MGRGELGRRKEVGGWGGLGRRKEVGRRGGALILSPSPLLRYFPVHINSIRYLATTEKCCADVIKERGAGPALPVFVRKV